MDSSRPRTSTVAPERRRRYLPLGARLAFAVLGVLAIAAAWASSTLADSARAALIESKRAGASRVLELFTASVAAALDFEDTEGLRHSLDALASNPEVDYAAIWRVDANAPIVEFDRRPKGSERPVPAVDGADVREDRIDFKLPINDPSARRLGTAVVSFSLLPEIERYREMRTRILGFSALLALVVSGVLLGIARWQIVGPLERLSRAARRLGQGEAARADVSGKAEVGNLASVFNQMSAIIVDREQSLRSLNARLQQLLDHMRQAIVVFRPSGIVEPVRSRQAEVIFGADVDGKNLHDLLYPDRAGSVEADALSAWLDALEGAQVEEWADLAEFAPTEVVLRAGTDDERQLALEFRPLAYEGQLDRIMLLATDETEKRRLEQTVERKEREHQHQLQALRRFVAGAELVLGLLRRSEERLERSREMLLSNAEDVDARLVNTLFQEMHSIKGEARAFDFALLEAAAASAEDTLAICRRQLREQQGIALATLRDMLVPRLDAVASQLVQARTMLVEASPLGAEVLERITVHRDDVARLYTLARHRDDAIGQAARRLASRPFSEVTATITEAAPQWASAGGKSVQIEVRGESARVPDELAQVLPSVLAHLVRNAVAHGIESPDARVEQGKPRVGRITIECDDSAGVCIRVSDDGRGIDRAAVLEAARGIGLQGERPEELVLAPEVTTRAEAGDLAGRGVGLSAVRSDLEAVGYGLRVESTPGQGTTVTIESIDTGGH